MKKTAIIYTSKYGSAERYAQWLAEETGADLYRSDVKTEALADYERIVFGGGIHAGGIEGMAKYRKVFKAMPEKEYVAFAVGLNLGDAERRECREINFRKAMTDIPCFFLRGAYDPEKVTGFDKSLMKFVKKSLEKKPEYERTKAESELLDAIENGADYVNRDGLTPLAGALKSDEPVPLNNYGQDYDGALAEAIERLAKKKKDREE